MTDTELAWHEWLRAELRLERANRCLAQSHHHLVRGPHGAMPITRLRLARQYERTYLKLAGR